MSIKPILFNTEMVKAILDGRKTVTRRVLAEKVMLDKKWGLDREPYLHNGKWYYDEQTAVDDSRTIELKPKYQPGNILYVRETWCKGSFDVEELPDGRTGETFVEQRIGDNDYIFKEFCLRNKIWIDEVTWRPSIHMPREAARIWLKVTNVRVERLQDITAEQARKEGVKDPYDYQDPSFYELESMKNLECDVAAFAGLWFLTLPKYYYDWQAWEGNPWVWVISFERCEKPEEVSH